VVAAEVDPHEREAYGGVGWLLAMFDLGRLGQLAWLSGAGAWLIA
jgi:hypothetical protein